ncbi:uncharacterized protein J4E92_008449 [Alternaria infectoria]|uniref:uncharacterized protein n=1 Tax=Alternaria infectoria TaxID=45303 RepID=UPI00221FD6FD|nr:uncharacterized protein J4E92_008449 [Alternaria infectoria]KAI4920231.1 hypothetical protein J4E92_008449 [Alternaria infectoria]
MSQSVAQPPATGPGALDGGGIPVATGEQKSGQKVAPIKKRQRGRRRQHKNQDSATVEFESSVASNALQAHEAFDDGDPPTTAGTAVTKEDDAIRPKARNARPAKLERARRNGAKASPPVTTSLASAEVATVKPAFAALAVMGPDVVLDQVDIIANRNSLRKLLDFSAGRKLDIFCMGLHMVGNTLVISRKERNAQQMIHGAPNAGYGHNFEKTFTMPDHGMGNSSSHHRVIRYHIGPLNCVVRFEVDAYYDDPGVVLDSKSKQPRDEPVSTVSAAMAQLNIAGLPPTQTKPRKTPADKPTVVVEKGTFIDPSKLAEIKAKKAARLTEALPQLWFGRTPYFMNGNHDKGTVHSVSISHAEKEYPRWEEANQDRLRKMVSLLAEIKEVVAGTKERAAVLVYDEKGGPLKVYAMKKNGGVLPADLISRHWSTA